MPNRAKQTPRELFTKEHQQLKADGERWMKDTATACNIAAALIATVVFAAAFTVPGGIDSATGIPLFSGQLAFVLFAISDAVALFTAVTSVLMFISILTSRYSEEDFLLLLPKRLIFGLLSLFVSFISMTIAFIAALYLVLRADIQVAWFLVLVAVLATLPIMSFVLSLYPILADVISSTYGRGIFGKN